MTSFLMTDDNISKEKGIEVICNSPWAGTLQLNLEIYVAPFLFGVGLFIIVWQSITVKYQHTVNFVVNNALPYKSAGYDFWPKNVTD